jgi:hypothetical protein
MPKVIIEPYIGQNYGGYYSDNCIVAVETDNIAAALAHEFRHFLQDYYGHTLVAINIRDSDMEYYNYNRFIRKYFHSSWSEMDALQFERKIAPSPLNKFWLEGLVLPKFFFPNLEM